MELFEPSFGQDSIFAMSFQQLSLCNDFTTFVPLQSMENGKYYQFEELVSRKKKDGQEEIKKAAGKSSGFLIKTFFRNKLFFQGRENSGLQRSVKKQTHLFSESTF